MANFAPGTVEAFIGSILEVLLYGIFLPIAWACSIVLYRRYRNGQNNTYMTTTFILLFVLVTMRFVIDTYRTVHAWTHPAADGSVAYEGNAAPVSILTNTVTVLETVVADAFLVYRAYVVYRKSWKVVIVPAVLIVGNLASGINFLYSLRVNTNLLIVLRDMVIWLYFTLIGNLLCTAMITYRIFTVKRKVSNTRQTGNDPVGRFFSVMLESAALYNTLVLIEIITIHIVDYSSFVFQSMAPASIGLVFGLIMLRASEGKALGDSSAVTDSAPANQATQGARLFELRSRLTGHAEQEQTKHRDDNMQITLNRVVETKVDSMHDSSSDKYPEV